MAIILLGHQPIDFTYKENAPCEVLSDMCLQYETGDNPMFQIRATNGSVPLVTIQGIDGDFLETHIPVNSIAVNGEFWTFTINFAELGISEGCFSICVYEAGATGVNLVTNGTFNSNLTGWIVADALVLDVASYTEDSVTLVATGGTEPYEYSIGGAVYQSSETFTGLSIGVTYTFFVRDAYNIIDSFEYTLRDCSSYAGSEAFDLINIKAAEINQCEAADFI